MARTNFENLHVYQLAEKLSDRLWGIVVTRDQFTKSTLGQQMVRAADSIGASIAEGSGRSGVPDRQRFVKIARGSLYETRHWLRRAYLRNLLTSEQVDELKGIIENLSPMLNAYLRSIGRVKASNAPDLSETSNVASDSATKN